MFEAYYYTKEDNKIVHCHLCPHECIIKNENAGICLVRKNLDGILISEVYNKPVAVHIDPIEKKPLYHYFPGSQVLSIGTLGCNLKCKFCQNCEISQISIIKEGLFPRITMEEILSLAKLKKHNIGLAYTYNEPVVFFEYMVDMAKIIKENNMKNIMVSNGYINPEPLKDLLEIIDAFNIDLKSFNDIFYRKYTKSTLNPVLKTISSIAQSGRHLEITFLAIPGLNDDFEEFGRMTDWILDNCGKKTVLHISKYFPAHKMTIPPTPLKTLEKLRMIAKKKLDYVYIGNMNSIDGNDTYCPVCNKLIILRNGYSTTIEGINQKGCCIKCGELILKHIA